MPLMMLLNMSLMMVLIDGLMMGYSMDNHWDIQWNILVTDDGTIIVTDISDRRGVGA